jgi:hypothetical protein
MFRLHIQHSDPARCMVIPFYDKNEAICFGQSRVIVIRYLYWSWYQGASRPIARGYRSIILTEGETPIQQFWPEKQALSDLYAPYYNTGFIYRRTFQNLQNRI